MLAVAGRPPDTAAWAIEMKWDGVRAIVVCDGDTCRLYSRNKRDITGSYPDLVEAIAAAARGRELILDGEIIAQTPNGAPSFGLLQRRMHVVRPSNELIRAVAVQFYAFDVLAVDGDATTDLPYLVRREQLYDLTLSGGLVSSPPHWLGQAADRMLELAREHHLEGIVSKETESTYHPGRRCPVWIKTPLRHTTEAIVAGWTPGNGMLAPTFGSLVLAAHNSDKRLVYIGNVGTGFTVLARRALRKQLDDLAVDTSPFDPIPDRRELRAARWVRPELVGDIEYREYTGDGLRHPSWRGLRTDKTPDEIKWELFD
ncbi:non-homologous end-joining DNA ligase [Nocardia sp. NPDC023852]|uniref:non-homologous end-joining DNA ligase n=1 Tax=Nocardia sp. NPDC023852 TaxID=3154697 RepID=UPI00340BFCAB